jgi:cytochrome b6-f complex iron-sulfur subunit
MKSKPMRAKKPHAPSVEIEHSPPSDRGVSRRGFFNTLWGILGLAAVAELVWIAVSFLRPSKHPGGGPKAATMVLAGAVESFVAGTVTAFQSGQFYLVRLDDGGFLALSCKCTHLGCTVPWVEKEKKFLCPCHASAFDITGELISTPAPRALDAFPVAIEKDMVKVDTSRRIKRSGFAPEQLVYPGKK